MGRQNELGERLDLALGMAGPRRRYDRTITNAMNERRSRYLKRRDAPTTSDTSVIQARLAAARANPRRANEQVD